MKATATLALLVATSTALLAEENVSRPLQSVPKNLARQHYATNLFVYDAQAQRYQATEAAAAWLDDDVATGWPALAGKQHYLLGLRESQLVTNFALSTRETDGTVTIYTGDQAAAPGDASWTVAVRDVPINSINQKKLATPLNKTAQYLLIETNIADPEPIYSLHLYGEKAAATEMIAKREQPVDIRTVGGEFVNNQTSFNLTSIYAKSLVTYANAGGGAGSWQRAIDDNPESFVAIKPSAEEAGLVARIEGSHQVSRLSVLSDPAARGTLDVFLLSEVPPGNQPVRVEGLTPSATLSFDGGTGRASADLPETTAVAVALRWTADEGATNFALRELNTFGDLSLSEYEVAGLAPTVAQTSVEEVGQASSDGKTTVDGKELMPIGEGKETVDFKGGSGKEELPPIAAGPTPGRGFRPGNLGFPPNQGTQVLPPDLLQPVSP